MGTQWSPLQFVEGMRGEPDGEEERQQCGHKPVRSTVGCE